MSQKSRGRRRGTEAPAVSPDGTPRLSYNRVIVGSAAACLLLTVAYLFFRVPLGIPGEWETVYRTDFAAASTVLVLVFVIGCFLGLAHLADLFAKRGAARVSVLPAILLSAVYAGVLFTTASTGPMGRPEFVAPAFGNGACSFFEHEAEKIAAGFDYGPNREIRGAKDYLARFPDVLESYREDFTGTIRVNNNPPGTTMVFYAALGLAKRSETLSDTAVASIFGRGLKLQPRFGGTILGAWILLLGAASSFVPAWLVARTLGGGRAFLAAAVSMLAVSMVLMNPNNDTFQVTFFLWMFYFFLQGRAGKAPLWGTLFGAAAAGAFFFTLATAVVVIVFLTTSAALLKVEANRNLRGALVFWTGAAGGLLAGFAIIYMVTGYNSLSGLYACYSNHRMFYANFERTYWKWVLYNPWEFAMFLGGPLAASVAYYAVRRPKQESLSGGKTSSRVVIFAALVVMAVLNFSGKNLSEVNRLWVFFMPLVALPAVSLVAADEDGPQNLWRIGALQALTLVVMRYFIDIWRAEAFFSEIDKYLGG